MALHIIKTHSERLLPTAALNALRDSVAKQGRVVLIVPTLQQVMEASKVLAGEPGLSVGVSIHTFSTWARERWEVYGDGRTPVSAPARSLLVEREVARAQHDGKLGPLDDGPGTVSLIASCARVALVRLQREGAGAAALTEGERVVCDLVRAYGTLLKGAHMAEECELLCGLPKRIERPAPVLVCATGSLSPVQLQCCALLAQVTDVSWVANVRAGASSDAARALLAELTRLSDALAVERDEVQSEPDLQAERAPELNALLSVLYRAGEEGVAPLSPTGALSLLLPAGPTAEPEAVVQQVLDLGREGSQSVAVVAPDAARAWREFAPRLAARGVSVRGSFGLEPLSTPVGRAFAGFCQTVAHLADLALTWPERPTINDETFDARAMLAGEPVDPHSPLTVSVAGLEQVGKAALGPMDWWPPSALTDFLLSGISGVTRQQAWDLDARWRANRVLSPSDVLGMLRKSSMTSPACAEAVQQLVERGSVGGAARALARGLQEAATDPSLPQAQAYPGAYERQEAQAVLQAFAVVAQQARALGVRNAREREGDAGLSLSTYVSLLLGALSASPLASRPALLCAGATCDVTVMSPREAATLPAGSVDALIYLGLDTQRSPIPRTDSAQATLLGKLGLGELSDPLARTRESFWSLAAAARNRLVLERTEFDASSSETFPAVMLIEALSCYEQPKDVPQRQRGEDLIAQNLSFNAREARLQATDVLPYPGRLRPEGRPFVTVAHNGSTLQQTDKLLLSATQLETYLDCPLKWFVSRRIGLEVPDAGFSQLEMGSFAHRVMELTHLQLLSQAYRAAHPHASCAEAPWEDAAFDPCERLEGSRVTPATLEDALTVLDTEFVRHLSHQYVAGTRCTSQALIPHQPSQRYEVQRLRDDLASSLEYEMGLFEGFEPRYFELPFGRAGMQQVSFAGANFNGTIDRVDVDAQGNALVIDYKHRARLFDEYALFDKALAQDAELELETERPFELPRHVQTLIYAQALKQLLPQLTTVGVVYLGTKGNHELSGAVAGPFAERVFGAGLAPEALSRVAVPGSAAGLVGVRSFDELLNRSEELLSEVVARIREGFIEASPRGDDGDTRYRYVCSWCPVAECERRRS